MTGHDKGRVLDRGCAGLFFDILPAVINGVGLLGAFLEALLADWRGGLDRLLLWGGAAVLWAASVLWWCGCRRPKGDKQKESKKSKKGAGDWIVWRTVALLGVYGTAVFVFRDVIADSIAQIFQNVLEMIDEQYGGEGGLQYGAELLRRLSESGVGTAEVRTLCLLAVLFPTCLLTAFFFVRGKWQVFLIGDVLWLAAAFFTDVFPDVFFLTLCVMGIVLAAAAGEFQDSATAWAQAAVGIMVFTVVGLFLIQRMVLPAIDKQYERSAVLRHNFYVTVNYKWLPRLQKLFPGSGDGTGVDVTGAFGRQRRVSGINLDVYRVTLDAAPRRTLYLRGFVGTDYARRKWEPEAEGALEQYYREHGFMLYDGGRELLNIGYAAAREGTRTNTVTIEELLGEGRYSLFPYGAQVTEEFPVHSDGAVDRIDDSYSFRYRDVSGTAGEGLAEQWRQVEEQYRQYVYAVFLDYPEERLPRLTQALEEMELPRGDVYGCAAAVIDFLEKHGTYRLDASATPVGKDYVEHFLFESHEGYCTHFASAAVLMFRYCGIPARYATGYSVSAAGFSRTTEDSYVADLTGVQAHAWAEVYVDGAGWVPVETTPGAAAFAGDSRGEMLRNLGILTGDIEPVPGEIYEDEEDEEEEEEERPVGGGSLLPRPDEDKEELGDGKDYGPGIGGVSVPAGLILIALFVCAVLFGRIRRLRWNRKLKKAEGQERVFLLYRNMRNALQLMGCSRKLVLTGEAFWERLKKVLPSQNREEYDTICAILEQSSFGNRAPSGEELETLGSLHDDMISRLYLIAPLYKKPAFAGLACVLPASHVTR